MHKLSFRAVAIETNSHHIIKNSLWFRIKSQTYHQMFFISQTSLSTSLPLSNRNEVTWIYLKVFERQEKSQPNAYLPQLSKMLLLLSNYMNYLTWDHFYESFDERLCCVLCSQGAAAYPDNEDQQQRLREAAEGLRVATNAAAQNAIKKKLVNRLEVSDECQPLFIWSPVRNTW